MGETMDELKLEIQRAECNVGAAAVALEQAKLNLQKARKAFEDAAQMKKERLKLAF
jgi:hypothetical protein